MLVGLGGIPTRLAFDPEQSPPDWHWLVPEAWAIMHERCSTIESLCWPFQDLLRSVDVLLTKPGYGAFAEAACHGVPVIYLERPEWPEAPFLTAWLETYGRAVPYVWSERWPLEIPELAHRLETMPRPVVPKPDGVDEAAGLLLELVGWA